MIFDVRGDQASMNYSHQIGVGSNYKESRGKRCIRESMRAVTVTK